MGAPGVYKPAMVQYREDFGVRRKDQLTLRDLQAAGLGRLDVACSKCPCRAGFWLSGLIAMHGADCGVAEFLERVTDACPQRDMIGLGLCGAHFTNLARH